MNRNFIFVFILLAALSMINAIPLQKRTTSFGKCPDIPELPTQPEQISASISPDPIASGQQDTFTISGKLSKEITTDYSIVIGIEDKQGTILAAFYDVAPPTAANTPFNVPVTESIPSNIPSGYNIQITIAEMTAHPPDVIGCTYASVGS